MHWFWWVLLSCGGLVLALAGLLTAAYIYVKIVYGRMHRVMNEGEDVIGWLVQANDSLFVEGTNDCPGFALISPDRATSEDDTLMLGLAERIMDLKGSDPGECEDKASARVAAWMRSETYRPGRRYELPLEFTGGQKVFLVHIFIFRDHLAQKRLVGPVLPLAIIWDEPGTPICTRPFTDEERRRFEKFESLAINLDELDDAEEE